MGMDTITEDEIMEKYKIKKSTFKRWKREQRLPTAINMAYKTIEEKNNKCDKYFVRDIENFFAKQNWNKKSWDNLTISRKKR